MRRVEIGKIRQAWRATIASQGLIYSEEVGADGKPYDYWTEGPYYDFTSSEIEHLEHEMAKLFQMCIVAVDHVVEGCPQNPTSNARAEVQAAGACTPDTCLISKWYGTPAFAHREIIRSWYDDDAENFSGDFSPSVIGRFDIRYDGNGPPKLLEFNADTPTCLPEAAVVQWHWHEDTNQGRDQWNGIHDALKDAWKRNISKLIQARPHLPQELTIHFACDAAEKSGEDLFNTEYMMEVARQAFDEASPEETGQLFGGRKIRVKFLWMSDIAAGDVEAGDRFYEGTDPDTRQPIHIIYKLYPWEYMYEEPSAKQAFRDMGDHRNGTVWIEPPYKMLWSNKALLAVLWKVYKDDPEHNYLLLPAYFADEKPSDMTTYVKKALLGREGANVSIVVDGDEVESFGGPYGDEGYIYQEFAALPDFPDSTGQSHYPVLGAWMIDGEPYGLNIRESDGLITTNYSRFACHVIDSYL